VRGRFIIIYYKTKFRNVDLVNRLSFLNPNLISVDNIEKKSANKLGCLEISAMSFNVLFLLNVQYSRTITESSMEI